VGGQKRGRFCLTLFPRLVFQVKPVRLDSVGHYDGRGPVPRALFNGRHPPRRAPALRVGYLPLNNALGTGPLPLLYLLIALGRCWCCSLHLVDVIPIFSCLSSAHVILRRFCRLSMVNGWQFWRSKSPKATNEDSYKSLCKILDTALVFLGKVEASIPIKISNCSNLETSFRTTKNIQRK
jgi:hypothetical protein